LSEQPAQVKALDTLRVFQRDRLIYRQEQVDQGLAEPNALKRGFMSLLAFCSPEAPAVPADPGRIVDEEVGDIRSRP